MGGIMKQEHIIADCSWEKRVQNTMEFEPEMHENSDKNEDASESNTVKESLTS